MATKTRPGLADYYVQRNLGESPPTDEYFANFVAFPIAYAAARAGWTPNHLSIGSGLFALATVAAGALAPASEPWSLLILFALAQISYLLDTADGQLARATGTQSRFGDFLDHGLDALSGSVVPGALFWMLYRAASQSGDTDLSGWVLALGFAYLAIRSANFYTGRFYTDHLGSPGKPPTQTLVQKWGGAMADHQTFLFGVLLALYSVPAFLALCVLQGVMMARTYVRYMLRAYRNVNG